MHKLINMSSYDYDSQRFDYNKDKLIGFINKYNFDGVELLNPTEINEKVMPREYVKGVHLRYYPEWLDFWREDREALLKKFESMENIKSYYGGTSRYDIINHLRREILFAEEIGAKYCVFHVSHAEMRHVFNYKFTYDDREVIDASIELINEVFREIDTNITLLLENLWWPGLRIIKRDMAERLIGGIEYKNIGFMLDTGHLMNTNTELCDEKQGIEYVLKSIEAIGEMKGLIKGIHLSLSLSGEYVRKNVLNREYKDSELTLDKMNQNIYDHITGIDMHLPFRDREVKKIVEAAKPDYLVYEFVTNTLKELEKNIELQDSALCLG